MSDIIKLFTKQQLYDLCVYYVLSKKAGLTDFNDGSKVKALLEMVCDIVSTTAMDFKEALYKAIPVALYEGFGFTKKAATSATGKIRFYRKPAMTLYYSRADMTEASHITVRITDENWLYVDVSGTASGDSFKCQLDNRTVDEVCKEINSLDKNFTATAVKGSAAASGLFKYEKAELKGSFDYLLKENSMDIMLSSNSAIDIPEGASCSTEGINLMTIEAAAIPAGESGVEAAAKESLGGTGGNISAKTLDTANGKGSINTTIQGVDAAINDLAFSGGLAAESDEERKVRFKKTVQALNSGTRQAILAAIEGVDGVRSAGMRVGYPNSGTNTIYVDTGNEGDTLSPDMKNALNKVIDGDPNDLETYPGKGVAGIVYAFEKPTVITINFRITISKLNNVYIDTDKLQDLVSTAITQYVNTLQLGEDVIMSEVIHVGKNASSAVYDIKIEVPTGNIIIDEAQIARVGKILISTISRDA